MKPSALDILSKIKGKLLQFPVLVDQLQNKDNDFIAALNGWIKETEIIFQDYNISEISELAGFRGKITAPLFGEPTRIAAKKKQLKMAAESLYDIQGTVLGVVKPYEYKVEEATNLLKQIMGLLKQTEVLKYHVGEDFQGFIQKIWTIFATHEQLKPSAMKILTLVSQSDAVRIIAMEIELGEWL